MRYVMAIDLKGCVGCGTCMMACKLANNLPDGIWWNRIETHGGEEKDTAGGIYPNNKMQFIPVSCQHCSEPACALACPTGAIYKTKYGIVASCPELCVGCRKCASACPHGSISFANARKKTHFLDFSVGDADAAPHPDRALEKCDFCYRRITKGEIPACMEHCPGDARFFGDLDEADSYINKLIKSRKWVQLSDELTLGVYYLI